MKLFEILDDTPRQNSDCAWCGGEVFKEYRNRRNEVFCSINHRTASNRALNRLLNKPVELRKEFVQQETLPGKKTLSVYGLSKKHGVSTQMIQYKVKQGTQIELEHTDNKAMAREIAMDHIAELLDYYDRLENE